MAPDIRQLDEATVDRIAAGEVVERPASVVKELVENSVDADASRVAVTVEAGGTERIEVRDDGRGMTEEEVRLAVREHTTSKIGDLEDLESGVATLGFRGEALHAVGAVSKLAVRTRKRGTDRGTELRVEGGDVTSVSTVGCPEGTTVEVRDLFYNVPARRKYLKTEATEFSRVSSAVAGYALAEPDVAVSLAHDDRETFATEGRGDRRAAVLAVYGREVAANMIPVEGTEEAGPLADVTGLVSHPETNRASREYVNTFVNGRWVTAGAVRDAAVEAYGRQLAGDRYPFAVLSLEVDPGTVDVNVHPRKMRVRYSRPEAVKRQVRTAVENALRKEGLLRSSAPRGRSAPDQANITPSSTTDGLDESSNERSNESSSDPALESKESDMDEPTNENAVAGTPLDTEPRRSKSSRSSSSGSSASSPTHPRRTRSPPTSAPTAQKTLSGDDAHPTTEYDNFPSLRVLGQLHDTYIVAEADDGLILIDQHAADERVNYERLKEIVAGDTTTQALAEPVQLELTAGEAAVFDTYKEALAQLGFHANRNDDRTVNVTTVPSLVAESAGPEVIRDVLVDLITGEDAAEQTVEAIADQVLSDMACYPSITGNTSLRDGSVVDLLSTLDDCENPWSCPHGRPVLIHIDSVEIDDRFERDYPGH